MARWVSCAALALGSGRLARAGVSKARDEGSKRKRAPATGPSKESELDEQGGRTRERRDDRQTIAFYDDVKDT
ncbi:hypothetical protein [Polyangium sp. 6x1]|uniref:hypothetical protein n=1 Tax=Polyangium sp. 6x1 TaxID=3042689 RepID=UPI002482721F|nr:hypothetical protein [Polyangium sp. 6x1]MDI1446133.1 hypothetical protein [Polyangium sp. 6x1]